MKLPLGRVGGFADVLSFQVKSCFCVVTSCMGPLPRNCLAQGVIGSAGFVHQLPRKLIYSVRVPVFEDNFYGTYNSGRIIDISPSPVTKEFCGRIGSTPTRGPSQYERPYVVFFSIGRPDFQ